MTDQMQSDKGTYILVIRLLKAQTIEIGAFGKFDFKLGWYAYVGSAFGAGGITARTARHLRRGKKHHWHVDYLREYGDLVEIWSLCSHPAAEHDVARILADMDGAKVPVPGFGSQDCKAGCPAHFFHFEKRPRASTLRAILGRQFPQHGPLSVKTTSGEADFDIGMRYLDERRKLAMLDGHNQMATPGTSLTCFSDDPVGCQIAERLADELRIPVSTMKEVARFAQAVDMIVTSCPEQDALGVMFSPDNPQEKDAVLKLSRTSPERQRHRIKLVANGKASTIEPQSEDTTVAGIFDTNDFGEVLKRLGRGRGSILKSLWLLENDFEFSVTEATARDMLSTVADCKRYACDLAKILKKPAQQAGNEWRQDVRQPDALTLTMAPGQLKSARTLIKKNVADVPRLGPDKQPTPEECSSAWDEINKIVAGSDAIVRLLNSRVHSHCLIDATVDSSVLAWTK